MRFAECDIWYERGFDDRCVCSGGWIDGQGNCWGLVADSQTVGGLTNASAPGGLFEKHGIDPWQFFANNLDCTVNPSDDWQPDYASQGPWPDSQGALPKCLFSLWIKSHKPYSGEFHETLPQDGAATKNTKELGYGGP